MCTLKGKLLTVLMAIFWLPFMNNLKAQSIDTTSLIASTLLQTIDFSQGIWTPDEIISLVSTTEVSLIEVGSKGIKSMLFFKISVPQYGVVIDEKDVQNQKTYDPYLIQPRKVFCFDLVTNNLFDLSTDTGAYSFKLLIPFRLKEPTEKIFKRRVWKSHIYVEGVDMEALRRLRNPSQ